MKKKKHMAIHKHLVIYHLHCIGHPASLLGNQLGGGHCKAFVDCMTLLVKKYKTMTTNMFIWLYIIRRRYEKDNDDAKEYLLLLLLSRLFSIIFFFFMIIKKKKKKKKKINKKNNISLYMYRKTRPVYLLTRIIFYPVDNM